MKKSLFTLFLLATSLVYSQNVIVDTLNCQGATVTLTQTVSTNIDCDSILSAHLFWVDFPTNPEDSIQTWWSITLTNPNIVVEPISFTFAPFTFTESGCYGYEVIVDCSNSNGIILSSTYYVNTVSIEELSLSRNIVKVTDILGRESLPEPNKLLIYHYSDGSTEKIITN